MSQLTLPDRTKQSPRRLVLTLGLAGLLSAADNWIVAPVLPAIAGSFAVTAVQAGVIITAYMIPYGLMQPVYGFLADRWGKRLVLRWIVVGLALGTLGCALSPTLPILCGWRFLTGFFAAGIIAVSLALIGDSLPPEQRQRYVGHFMGMVFLGQGISVGLGGLISQYANWRVTFAVLAAGATLMLWLLQTLPSGNPAPGSGARRSFLAETLTVCRTPLGRVIFPLALAAGFLLIGIYSYLGVFLHIAGHLNYLEVGLVLMFFGLACLTAGAVVGRLAHRLSARTIITIGGLLAVIAALFLYMSPDWRLVWTATILLGFGYIFIQSTLATLAFDVAADNKGLPSALIGVGLFGGGGLGSAFGGWLLHTDSYQTLWLAMGAGLLLFTLVAAARKSLARPQP